MDGGDPPRGPFPFAGRIIPCTSSVSSCGGPRVHSRYTRAGAPLIDVQISRVCLCGRPGFADHERRSLFLLVASDFDLIAFRRLGPYTDPAPAEESRRYSIAARRKCMRMINNFMNIVSFTSPSGRILATGGTPSRWFSPKNSISRNCPSFFRLRGC